MKTVIVTGGSGGIGSEICKVFRQKGYNTALIYNKNYENALKIKQTSGAYIYQADVTDAKSIECAFSQIKKDFGQISAIINCAGITKRKLFLDFTDSDFDNIFSVNLKGVCICCQKVLPYLLENGGHIINISSIWGERPASCEVVYSASKGGVNMLSKSLAEELYYSNVRVNTLSLGYVETSMNSGITQEEVQDFLLAQGLSRKIEPIEVGEKCLKIIKANKTGKNYRLYGNKK